jgi:hypothetical protein
MPVNMCTTSRAANDAGALISANAAGARDTPDERRLARHAAWPARDWNAQ